MLLTTALLIIGLFLVVYGADRLAFAASILCRSFGVPPIIIGVIVVSMGTSLPRIVASVVTSMNGQLGLAARTTIGPNTINVLPILDLSALTHSFTVHFDVLRRELPLMLLVGILATFVLHDGQLDRSDGFFFLLLAVLWLLSVVKITCLAERQGSDSLTREQITRLSREGGLPATSLWLGIALITMPTATRMVVDNATALANYFAMNEPTIGLTTIAIGIGLPGLAIVITGLCKDENDTAVGNTIGTDIFNIVIILGLSALITPGEVDPMTLTCDYSVMLLMSVTLALLCWRHPRQIGRGAGALLTGGFIIWLVMLYQLSPLLVGQLETYYVALRVTIRF